MKIVLPPFRFVIGWLSFGFCITTGITCLFYLFGIGKTSDLSSLALHQLSYNPRSSSPGSNQSDKSIVAFDILEDCPNFSEVIENINRIKQNEAAVRVSLYSSGVHWSTAWSHQTFGFPIYVLCLSSGFIALTASIINCIWPPNEDMPSQPGKLKVRKIRMRVPQKHQKWSGYIYTHLYDDPPLPEQDPNSCCGTGSTNGSRDPSPSAPTRLCRPDEDNIFDREALKFIQKTISTCGSKERMDNPQCLSQENLCAYPCD